MMNLAEEGVGMVGAENWFGTVENFALTHQPYAIVVALVILILFLKILVRFTSKRGVKKRSHEFLCLKRKKTIIDGVHSFYLSNPKVEFSVAISDLVARSLINEKDSHCPGKGSYKLSIQRHKNGHLFDCIVSCSKHGPTCLDEL